MQFRTMKLADLIPADYNPRKALRPGDPEYEKLRRSLEEFGCVDPLIWNTRTNRLVGGHQRLTVMRDLGWTEAEVSVVDLPEEKEKALNVALNKISGEWDMDRLRELLVELESADIDVTLTGFDMEELSDILPKLAGEEVREDNFDADAEAAAIIEPVTRRGDLYRLGDHRLLCGDSTDQSFVIRLMDGHMADLFCTDPPYNVQYDQIQRYRGEVLGKRMGIDRQTFNDDMPEESYYNLLRTVFDNAFLFTRPGGAIYVWHADSHGLTNRRALIESGWLLKQNLIWVKNAFTLGRQDYQWRHESCLYGWKPGAGHYWCGEFNHGTVTDEEDKALQDLSKPDLIRLVRRIRNDLNTTVIHEDKPQASPLHPTVKPIVLIARLIRNSTPLMQGLGKATVLDLFCGSGTAIIAAEQLGRKCYGMELDPVYCDVIVKRWEQFTGGKAELLRGGEGEGAPVRAEDLGGVIPAQAAG